MIVSNLENKLNALSSTQDNLDTANNTGSFTAARLSIKEAKGILSGVVVKICGIITCCNKRIYLEDYSSAIELKEGPSTKSFHEGDMVEVIGTLNKTKENVALKKYKVKKLTNFDCLSPASPTIAELFEHEEEYSCRLVTLTNVKISDISPKGLAKVLDLNKKELDVYIPFRINKACTEYLIDITGIFCCEKKPYLYVKSLDDMKEKDFISNASFFPSNLSSIFQRTPKIKFKAAGDCSLFLMDKSKVYVNGSLILNKINGFTFEYIPEKPLPFGKNYVEVELTDIFNKTHKYICSFFVLDKETKYHYFYGVPHCHTSYSDGKGTVITASECARKSKLDFLIATEHSPSLIAAEKTSFSKWKASLNEAEEYNKKHKDFLALVGIELSSTIWGHINALNCKTLIDKRKAAMKDLINWIAFEKEVILTVNHPFRVRKNISFSQEMDNYFNFMEVGNGAPPRTYIRTFEEFFAALDEGWHFGAVNGQDNHTDNWGVSDNVTAVIAEHLTSTSFIEALRARRVYSTESKSLKLVFKADNYWMGSIIDIKAGTDVEFNFSAEDKHNSIDKFQLISNGGIIISEKSYGGIRKAEWRFMLTPNSNYTWFVGKVLHKNQRVSLSSPIFINIIEP